MDPGRIDFLVDIAYGVLIFVAIVLIRRGRRQGRTRRPGEGVGRELLIAVGIVVTSIVVL